MLTYNIQNAYLTAKCKEKVWIKAGAGFGSESANMSIVKMALYILKSSDIAFISKLAGVLHDMNYWSSFADPDIWMRPATKLDCLNVMIYLVLY